MSLAVPSITIVPTLLLIGLAACGPGAVTDPPAETDPPDEECDPATAGGCEPPLAGACDPQPVPAGRTCVRWTPADGVRHLDPADTFDILVIDAGTEVRAAAGVWLVATQLHVNGAAAAPVVFLPLTEGVRWGGIWIPGFGSDTSRISHARIATAEHGIFATAPALIEDTHVEDIAWVGVFLRGGHLVRSIIEGAQAVGVSIGSNSHARMSDTDVRGSGHGISLTACIRCSLVISGGTIENNTGDGVRTEFIPFHGGTVIFESPVRITGNAGYPLVVPLISMRGVMNDVAARSNLLGNGGDTVIAYAGSTWGDQQVPPGDLNIARALPFRVVLLPCHTALPLMTMEAGASLTVESDDCFGPVGGWPVPVSYGTPSEPVTITGIRARLGLVRQGADTVFVRHARFRNIRLASAETPVVMEDVELDSSSLAISASGSRVARLRSSGGGFIGLYDYQQAAAITLGADVSLEQVLIEGSLLHGLHINGGSPVVSGCTIRGSAGHGVWVEQGTVRIEQCSLEGNAGHGIHNSTPDTVHARNNWWGDPMGPNGSSGDGVDGPVWYEPFLTAPPAANAQAFTLYQPCCRTTIMRIRNGGIG